MKPEDVNLIVEFRNGELVEATVVKYIGETLNSSRLKGVKETYDYETAPVKPYQIHINQNCFPVHEFKTGSNGQTTVTTKCLSI